MSKLIAITYDEMGTAKKVMDSLVQMQTAQIIDLEDAAYITKNSEGKLKLHQSTSLAGVGAASGAIWGFLFGLLFFAPFLGSAIGAATGAVAGKLSDYGIDDKFAKELGDSIKPNSSAVFMLVRRATADKALAELSKYGGRVIKTSLTEDQEQKLQAALNIGN